MWTHIRTSFPPLHIYKSATSSHSKPGLFGTTTLTLLLPWFVNVFTRNSWIRSLTDSRSGFRFPAGSCVSRRLSPEQSLHRIPESENLRNSGHQQLRFRASACSCLRLFTEPRFPNSAHPRIRDFAGPRLPGFANSLLLKNILWECR
jgi:hypothetical protein